MNQRIFHRPSIQLFSFLVRNLSSNLRFSPSQNYLLKPDFLAFNTRHFNMANATVGGKRDFVFRQLFDRESCTYSYLLGDNESKESILIDPVFELAERDVQLVKDLGLTLKYVINTHVHADHVTGTGKLKKLVGTSLKSMISKNAGAEADIFIDEDDKVEFGPFSLSVKSTPGHTNGCVTYVFDQGQMVFTGDTLLIRGCGRTDFQEGSSESLFDSVQKKIFALPDHYLVYPAHDYKGITCSSIGEEKKYNPRLIKTKEQFQSIMANLNLSYPKMIDKAVPANKVCGLYNLPEEFQEEIDTLNANMANLTVDSTSKQEIN